MLRATLEVLSRLTAPGRVDLPRRWPEGKRARVHPPKPPSIVGYLRKRPWHLVNLIRGKIPDEP